MSVSAALQEARASADVTEVILSALTLAHSALADPIHLVSGIDPDPSDPEATVLLPLTAGGTKVGHYPCAFAFTPPGADRDGPTDAKITVDNVSQLLEPHLEAILGFNEPIAVTYREFVIGSGGVAAVTGPDEIVDGLIIRDVTLDAVQAEGTATYRDGRDLNVPTGPYSTFDPSDYPGLWG